MMFIVIDIIVMMITVMAIISIILIIIVVVSSFFLCIPYGLGRWLHPASLRAPQATLSAAYEGGYLKDFGSLEALVIAVVVNWGVLLVGALTIRALIFGLHIEALIVANSHASYRPRVLVLYLVKVLFDQSVP